MKKLVFLSVLVLAIALGVGQSQASTCNLLTLGATCTNPFGDGVNFEQIDQNPVGTGNFQPFLRIQAAPVEEGYNTDARPVESFNDAKADPWTHSVQLGMLGALNVGGTDYYVFDLDINEQNNPENHLLTLNDVELWINTIPNDNVYSDGLGTLVYQFTNDSVELDFNLEAGSGWGDMHMFVPTSYFVGQSLTSYLYLYSAFGNPNTSGDGFEEWRFRAGGPIPPPPVPEPSTLLLLGSGLIGLGALRRKLKK